LQIQQWPILEKSANGPPDGVLMGLMNVVQKVTGSFEDRTTQSEIKALIGHSLVEELWSKCLFSLPHIKFGEDVDEQPESPKCKVQLSRIAAFNLLHELCRDCSANRDKFVKLLMQQVAILPPCSKWHYAPTEAGKASNGYVGLRNLGNTCYINATIQQLYNMPKFRYGIFSAGSDMMTTKKDDAEGQLLSELWNMFSWLDLSNRQAYDPYGFCKAYRHNNEPVDVLVQMDASEFFTSLCEQIEEALKDTPQKGLLGDVFGGKVCEQLVCLGGCNRVNEKREPFHILALDVQNYRSLYDACEAYVQGEVLEDFRCEECQKQVKTRKRAALCDMSNTLIISLKRFEFDYNTFTRRKLNDYFEFPEHLDLWPYSVEGIEQRDAAGMKPVVRQYLEHPQQYYEYALRGAVVHMGSAETGHYYSFIKERQPRCNGQDCQWLRFDDALVTEFDIGHKLQEECFGGAWTERTWDKVTGQLQERDIMLTRSAYMLVYERVETPDGNLTKGEGWYERMMRALPDNLTSSVVSRFPQTSSVVSKLNSLMRSGAPSAESPPNAKLFEKVLEDNLAFSHDQQIMDSSYLAFVEQVLSALPVSEYSCDDWDAGPNTPALVALKAITSFTLEVTVHARETSTLPSVIQHLKVLFNGCLPACRWMLESITVERRWLQHLLLECPIQSTRLLFVDLLVCILRRVAHFEDMSYAQRMDELDENSEEEPDQLLTLMLAQRMIGLLDKAQQHRGNFAEYFRLFYEIARLGKTHSAFLIENRLITRLVEFVLRDQSQLLGPGSKPQSQMSRGPVGEKGTVTNSCTSLLNCLSHLVRCSMVHKDTQVPPPTLLEAYSQHRPLSDTDLKVMSTMEFYRVCLKEHPVALSEILCHVTHDWFEFIDPISDVFYEKLVHNQPQQWDFVFQVMCALLKMEDRFQNHRCERFLNAESGAIAAILSHRSVQVVFWMIERIRFLDQEIPAVHRYMCRSRHSWQQMDAFYFKCAEQLHTEHRAAQLIEQYRQQWNGCLEQIIDSDDDMSLIEQT